MKKIIILFFISFLFPLTVYAETTDVKNTQIIKRELLEPKNKVEEIFTDSSNEEFTEISFETIDYTKISDEKLVELLYEYRDLKNLYPEDYTYSNDFEDIAREIANRNEVYEYEIKEVKAKCTYYDSCYNCCNKDINNPNYKKTASGQPCVEGITAAMDKSIPFGSLAISNDFIDETNETPFNGVLVKHDVGGAIENYQEGEDTVYRIDIFVDTASCENVCGVFGHSFAGRKGLHTSDMILIINKE